MTDDTHIRAAFHEVALELMSWQDSPLMGPVEYRRLEDVRQLYRPFDKQGEVEPFDVSADWEEMN